MMTCKDVSTLVSLGDPASWPVARRLAVWFHLLMCRQCRAFARQVETLARTARRVGGQAETEPAGSFEAAIVDRLKKG
ncbi:MAG: hypothetical protein Q7J25_08685 [Vicinamibacterales bacterium]|nr:hypothetical protein [Vicinamibacterales bacterium]